MHSRHKRPPPSACPRYRRHTSRHRRRGKEGGPQQRCRHRRCRRWQCRKHPPGGTLRRTARSSPRRAPRSPSRWLLCRRRRCTHLQHTPGRPGGSHRRRTHTRHPLWCSSLQWRLCHHRKCKRYQHKPSPQASSRRHRTRTPLLRGRCTPRPSPASHRHRCTHSRHNRRHLAGTHRRRTRRPQTGGSHIPGWSTSSRRPRWGTSTRWVHKQIHPSGTLRCRKRRSPLDAWSTLPQLPPRRYCMSTDFQHTHHHLRGSQHRTIRRLRRHRSHKPHPWLAFPLDMYRR
mmetsp:Transcript_40546/g.106467  ORF Transcript_40546/g.106467 Transcript_40546/m.106467 type:complete len:286 (-) Transcript_40546:1185-2042(-)